MEGWKKALNKFLGPWRDRDEVIGFLVCGSYITGNPSKRSDIDLHIITSDDTEWRERGTSIVDEYLIEYFVNPPRQIRAYFKQDHGSNRRDTPTQFATGKTLHDKNGSIAHLKKEAKDWLAKKFTGLDNTGLSLQKYALWDTMDNLRDIHERKSKSFNYAYYSALKTAIGIYSRYLKTEIYPAERVHELLTDPAVQRKYLQHGHPDPVFRDMYVKALTVDDHAEMLECFQEITDYTLKQTGGFKLDGWVIRTPLGLD